ISNLTSPPRRRDSHQRASVKPGAVQIVVRRGANGHWQYFNPIDDADSGSVVDFVQNKEGLNLGQVRKVLRAWLRQPARLVPEAHWQPRVEIAQKDRHAIAATVARLQHADRSDFLEGRGITPATLAAPSFRGRVLAG